MGHVLLERKRVLIVARNYPAIANVTQVNSVIRWPDPLCKLLAELMLRDLHACLACDWRTLCTVSAGPPCPWTDTFPFSWGCSRHGSGCIEANGASKEVLHVDSLPERR